MDNYERKHIRAEKWGRSFGKKRPDLQARAVFIPSLLRWM
jgi:hypothetical protein